MLENYQAAVESIYSVIDEIYEEVKMYQNIWMQQVARKEKDLESMKSSSKSKEGTRYELDVEFSNNTFGIRWALISFYTVNGRTRRLRKRLKSPQNGRYSKTNFSEAAAWELELILKLEETFFELRAQLKNLMKAHRYILEASKAAGVELEKKEISQRVTKLESSIAEYKKRFN